MLKLFIVLFVLSGIDANGQTLITYEGDTLKGNVRVMTEYNFVYSWSSFMKSVYTWDSVKKIETARFYDEINGRCGGTWVISFDNDGRIINEDLYCATDTLCKRVTYSYNKQGWKIGQRTVNCGTYNCGHFTDWLGGTITEWAMGRDTSITLAEYKYDDHGRKIATKKLTTQIKSHDTITEIKSYQYDKEKRVVEFVEKEIDILNGRMDSCGTTSRYKYDDSGNKVEDDKTGWRYSNTGSYYSKSLFRYNKFRQLIETKEYFSVANNYNDKPNLGICIGVGTEYTYDEQGNEFSSTSFKLYKNDKGLEIKDRGIARNKVQPEVEEKEYDRVGNLIKKT